MIRRRTRKLSEENLLLLPILGDDESKRRKTQRLRSSKLVCGLRSLLFVVILCLLIYHGDRHRKGNCFYNVLLDLTILGWSTLEHWNLIDDPPPFDFDYKADYPFLEAIENNYTIIRSEALALHQTVQLNSLGHLVGNEKSHMYDKRWKTFPIQIAGSFLPQHEALCPQTAHLLHTLSNDIFDAFIMVLEPNTHANAHWGYWKGFHRYQLGLVVPENNQQTKEAFIRVSQTVEITQRGLLNVANRTKLLETAPIHYYEEGRGIVFDDSRLHDVWNNSPDQIRIILFLDLFRKLPRWMDILNRWIMSVLGWSSQFSQSFQDRLRLPRKDSKNSAG